MSLVGIVRARPVRRIAVVSLVLGVTITLAGGLAAAAEAAVGLGTATSYAVLAGTGVTNTGPTVINGDLGTCPTPAITGFPPGTVNGATHANDAQACQAKSDLVTAYNDAAGRAPNTTFPGATELGGTTLLGGVYKSPTSFAITGTLTLNAQGDPSAVWIFQAGSTLGTAVNSNVSLTNGAQACNVFWQIGSSATLGVGSNFVGTIMALESISANTNAVVAGRLLARNGATTLDSNTVNRPACAAAVTTTTAAPGATTTTAAPGATTTTVAPGATTTTAGGATTTTVAPGATTTTTSAGATTTTATGGTPTTAAPGTTTTSATTSPPSGTTTTSPGVAATTTTRRAATATTARQGGGPGNALTAGLPPTGSSPTIGRIGAALLALGCLLLLMAEAPRRAAERYRN